MTRSDGPTTQPRSLDTRAAPDTPQVSHAHNTARWRLQREMLTNETAPAYTHQHPYVCDVCALARFNQRALDADPPDAHLGLRRGDNEWRNHFLDRVQQRE